MKKSFLIFRGLFFVVLIICILFYLALNAANYGINYSTKLTDRPYFNFSIYDAIGLSLIYSISIITIYYTFNFVFYLIGREMKFKYIIGISSSLIFILALRISSGGFYFSELIFWVEVIIELIIGLLIPYFLPLFSRKNSPN